MMIIDGKYYSYKKSEGMGYDAKLRDCIETACQCCLDNTNKSDAEKIDKPIMLLGKIQSGKTRAYTGLIALAFDNGFDMVFILSKNSKALINQTVSRMKKEFSVFIQTHEVIVSDIMKSDNAMSGYQLEQKKIMVSKKQSSKNGTSNIDKVLEFIKCNAIDENHKCLIIDDEADTTGIGFTKHKGKNEYCLREVASKVNEMRRSLDGCVFVQVTATPYALYLQPEFDEKSEIFPIKPLNTILVPYGKDYVGGDYYFIKSKDESHPASMLFEPVGTKEHDIVSGQKRKGKKSKIEDKRRFRIDEILIKENSLPVFKKGIINFFVGVIALSYRDSSNKHFSQNSIGYYKKHYAYAIHTATDKKEHELSQDIIEVFLDRIRNRTSETELLIEKMLRISYNDIMKSVIAYEVDMPPYDEVRFQFFNAIDKKYYSVIVVNSDKDVENLLDENGELNLPTPFSIFVGGQVLDRGVTIPNMIGFYYGRNPKTMQQDTVLQHSRMFGYRKPFLPVTRFYTTERIHSNMEKIAEIDIALREDIESGKQGNGVYFITRKEQDCKYGTGYIKPCSPDKIRVSDILLLEPHKRILPVGFSPVCKTDFEKTDKRIEQILSQGVMIQKDVYLFEVKKIEELLSLVYNTFKEDDESYRFITFEEMMTSIKYLAKSENVYCTVSRNKDNDKFRSDGRLHDSPDTGSSDLKKARALAKETPCLMLFKEKGAKASWNGRAFWWPVLVSPQNVPKTIYASKIVNEKILPPTNKEE